MKPLKSIWDDSIILNDYSTAVEKVTIKDMGEKQISRLRYEPISAYGQNGYTKLSEDAYEGFERTTTLNFLEEHSYEKFMREIYVGLDVKVYYSDDNGKFRYGVVSEVLDTRIHSQWREVTVTVNLQPFKYEDELTIDITEETTIYNTGNIYTTPIIKVYGNGIGNIYIGNQRMKLDVNEHITVNNKDGQQDVFNKDGLRANSKRLEGNFMRINTGSNTITFDGAITKLEIAVSWRWR